MRVRWCRLVDDDMETELFCLMVTWQEIAASSIANCPKKHPTVLHTNFVAQKPELVNPPASLPSHEGVAHVHNAMVCPDGKN
ncbi:hypothetical protein P5673_023586 [Acropora cervicornis]|uniref:Uncharacterized protein n=1 Tax=Acropora cervicornis TaxID=6130 RepID=A0AAD9Q541_ACRCE|nr:hypothetical protein P5673_023586 [Acropora cervicornis]